MDSSRLGGLAAAAAAAAAAASAAALLWTGCSSERITRPGEVYSSVGTGDEYSCALTTTGRVFCWGTGVFGQLGNGAAERSLAPVAVAGGLSFAALTVGNDHACGLTATGAAYCWGANDFHELGFSTTTCNSNFQFVSCASAPAPVSGGLTFSHIEAGSFSTCGLTTSGAAFCWGWNSHGQVGNDSIGKVTPTPGPVTGGLTFAQLSLDRLHACAGTSAGALFCWGSDGVGELGATTSGRCVFPDGGSLPCSSIPLAAAGGASFARVSAGYQHTCALTATGVAYCWGSNAYAVLGDPAAPGGPQPVAVTGGLTFADLSSGLAHSCGVSGGAAYCWGDDEYGQLGATPTRTCAAVEDIVPCEPSPVKVAASSAFRSISAGTWHTCAVTTDGDVYCWGRGTEGQLGNGAQTSSTTPVRVELPR